MLRYAILSTFVAIVGATSATVWLVAEVRKEQHAIEEIVRGGIQEDIVRLGTLPGEIRWQLLVTVLVLAVLVGAGLALAFGTRAYIRSQASLRHVVTEQALVEEQMRRMERFTGLAALTAGLHHEIKNPLGALSLHVQLLEEQLDAAPTDEPIAESLSVVKEEVSRIARVLESFRDYASVDALELVDVDPFDLLEKTVRLIRPTAERIGIVVEIEESDDARRSIRVDSVRIEQLLLNLEMNAIEAMPSGGSLTLGLEVDEEHDHVVIFVTDSGPGIPEVARDRIFDPYYSTKAEGTGLGLAFSDKIARQHGGYITFETGTSGTTFRVSLPTASGRDTVAVRGRR